MGAVGIPANAKASQFKKPQGWLGRLILRNMNSRHSKVTDWGLSHVSIESPDMILDVGCGGGRTLYKLAERATQGKVYGLDYSEASVATSKKTNARWIEVGRVELMQSSVSQLPFPNRMFDLVTAVETHFWWPDLPEGVREIFRVVKPGGKLIIIAEVYKGANTKMARLCEKHAPRTGMTLLDAKGHRELLVSAGFSDVQVLEEREKGWICAVGTRP
jgi:ubiquinone/menaquinone biosynthesis C-methylase UbiE